MAEEFTIAPFRRLLKKAGELRINPEATNEFRRIIGKYGQLLAKYATENAVKEHRKTVLERDIKAAEIRVRHLEAESSEQ